MNLCDQVFESLDNAKDNGYDDAFRDMTPEEVACDLLEFDSSFDEFDGLTQADITPFVVEWMAR